ncbi:MAG: protealysin inhibitor emfourin [Telluria sp.]
MKITLEQAGGLAGIRRRFVLDTSDLGEARDEVESLARTVGEQPGASGSPHPDAMAYTLTIAGEDGTREVGGMDSASTAEFGKLVDQVRKHGKALAA